MKIRVIDFEIITKHYKNYRDGVDKINAEKDKILMLIEPIKKEMNSILSSASSGLIVDQRTQKQQAEKFQQLQSNLVEIDNNFKVKNKEMVDELNTTTYDELSEIISFWARKNSVDLVSGKMEIIFSNPEFESTDEILEILKSKDLYVDRPINNKESEEDSENEKESV